MNRLCIKNLFGCVSRFASRVRRFHPNAPASRLSPFTLHPSPQIAFTLIEVNLAIFIMAAGLLAMVAIYPLAYRENRQSKDDVKAAAAADYILNSLTAALSSRNIKWNEWENGIARAVGRTNIKEVKDPDKDSTIVTRNEGWLAYCKWEGSGDETAPHPKAKGEINSLAKSVFADLAQIPQKNRPSWGLSDSKSDPLVCAIVAMWGKMPVFTGDPKKPTAMVDDRSRVAIGVRVAHRAGDILSQPIFYTEVHFQGDQENLKE